MDAALATEHKKRGRKPGYRVPKKPLLDVVEEGFNAEDDENQVKAFTIPRPPNATHAWATIVKDSGEFFEWWTGLSFPGEDRPKSVPEKGLDWTKPAEGTSQSAPRYKCYIKRLLPVCDPGLVNADAFKYIQVSTTWPFWTLDGQPEMNWRKGILESWGSGQYRFEMIDIFARRSIAIHEIHLEDWANYPPKLNLETLLVDHKSNLRWVQQMRMKGIKMPGDKGYGSETTTEEGELMAGALDSLVGRLADVALAKDNSGGSSEAVTVEVIRSLANQKQDPFALMSSMADVFAKLQGGKQNDSDVVQQMRNLLDVTNQQMLALQNEMRNREASFRDQEAKLHQEIRQLERELSKTREELMIARVEKDDIGTAIDRVSQLKEKLGVRSIRRRIEQPEHETPGVMEMLAPLLPQLIQALPGLLGQTPTAALAAVPAAAVPQQQQQQPENRAQKIMGDEYQMFEQILKPAITSMKVPLINYLSNPDTYSGHDFADLVTEVHGETTCVQLRGLGENTLIKAIIAHDEVWPELQKLAVSPDRLKQFAQEFVAGPLPDEEEGEEAPLPPAA